jgi:hypothetical protein
MAIATLSNFTVPLASDQSASSQGMLMPKLKYRFRVSFENFGVSTPTTELTKQVISTSRPKVSFTDTEVPVYNSTIHIAGKPKWTDLSIKLRDDVTGAVSKLVGEQNQKQFDFFEQSSAASGMDYKFTTRIEILDGGNGANTPNVLETWICYGCYVKETTWEGLDYKENGPAEITLTITMDNALQSPTGAGIGAAISRTTNTGITGSGSR